MNLCSYGPLWTKKYFTAVLFSTFIAHAFNAQIDPQPTNTILRAQFTSTSSVHVCMLKWNAKQLKKNQ